MPVSVSVAETPPDDRRQRLTLRLQFGEISFFRKTFNSVIFRCELTPIPPDTDALSKAALKDRRTQVVFFSGINAESRQCRLRWRLSAIYYSPAVFPLHCVDLTGSLEEYLAKFSSSSRKHLRRDLSKFEELTGTKDVFREYRQPDEMADYHETARAVSKVTFQERLLGVGLPETPDFLEQLREQARQDSVRGYVLFDKNRPVAFAHCSARGRHLSYEIVGYDPAYRDYSPGRILLYLLIMNLFRDRRFSLLDFGGGQAFYKGFFATHSQNCADVYYFRTTLPNAIFIALHFGLAATSRAATVVASKLGIKDKLKRWTRQKLRT